MLALLPHVLHTRRVDVLARSHRRNLDSPIGDALSCDKLFIKFGLGGTLLHDLHDRLVLSESAHHVEVLGLDHMVLLRLQQMLGLLLLQIHLLLQVETGGKGASIGGCHCAICVLCQFFRVTCEEGRSLLQTWLLRLQSHDRAFFVQRIAEAMSTQGAGVVLISGTILVLALIVFSIL